MTDRKVREIDLKLISDDVICRAILNEETALQYSEMMEAGVVFPPIDVFEKEDGSYIIGDGRTRFHAAGLALRKTIACFVHPKASFKEILIFAFNANFGVGNEMRFADARHTIMRLIEEGCGRKYIQDQLRYSPTVFFRLYTAAARNIMNKRCYAALAALSKNPKMSMQDAASLYKLKADELAAYLKRNEKKKGKSSANQMQATIHLRAKAFTAFQANILKLCMQRYQSGEMGADDVRTVLTAFDAENGKHRKNLVNWQNRFSKIDGPGPNLDLPYSCEKTKAGYVMKPRITESASLNIR
jgi:hypothetical protein